MKLSDWHVEYTVTFLVIFAAILLIIPTSLKSNFQANLITKWKDCYKKLAYAHDTILKQEKAEILTSFRRAKTPYERKVLFLRIMKPYFRISDKKVKKRYQVRYMNNVKVALQDSLHIDDYYYADGNLIVGIKDVPDLKDKAMFIMTFDVNGILPPNTWGKDVFGAKVYPDKVEAIGRELTIEQQDEDCSSNASGISCSNYYIIGGAFND